MKADENKTATLSVSSKRRPARDDHSACQSACVTTPYRYYYWTTISKTICTHSTIITFDPAAATMHFATLFTRSAASLRFNIRTHFYQVTFK
jgi:hypothetical protein